MNKLIIRKTLPIDIHSLQKIAKQTFLETYASGNTEEDMQGYLQEEFSLNKLKCELNDTNSEFHFALAGNEVVGYIKFNFGPSQTELNDNNSIEIQRIYVLKEYQNIKIGQSLYQKAVEVAKEKELYYLWLGVWEENPKAIRFYEKLGFQAFDKHIFKLGDDEQTDIMMKLELISE